MKLGYLKFILQSVISALIVLYLKKLSHKAMSMLVLQLGKDPPSVIGNFSMQISSFVPLFIFYSYPAHRLHLVSNIWAKLVLLV